MTVVKALVLSRAYVAPGPNQWRLFCSLLYVVPGPAAKGGACSQVRAWGCSAGEGRGGAGWHESPYRKGLSPQPS
eukprot:SAG25_NODE_811_length_5236_cov_107.100253_5_plen_75_part_00